TRSRELRRGRLLPGVRLVTFALTTEPGAPMLADVLAEPTRPSKSAPAAAVTFNPTPTQVVPCRPSVGTSQKPAASAPSAAPAVFDAYRYPAPEKDARPLSYDASQPAAIGKVAPIAAAGTPRSARLMTTRTMAKRAGAAPSAYAHAR